MEKNVQIPLSLFLDVAYLLTCFDENKLRNDILGDRTKEVFKKTKTAIDRKADKLRNRAAFTEYVKCDPEKKEAALQEYLLQKKITNRNMMGGSHGDI